MVGPTLVMGEFDTFNADGEYHQFLMTTLSFQWVYKLTYQILL